MNISESVTLFGVMVALAALPSASVTLIVSRSATMGFMNGLAVSAGVVAGDLIFIVLAFYGLSVVAETMGSLFVLVKIVGGLYLIWTGYSLFSKRERVLITANQSSSKRGLAASFMAGLILTLGDVQAVMFYASLLPAFVDLSTVQSSDVVVLTLITVFGVGGVKIIYAIFAHKIASYAQNTNMEIAARKTVGGLMMGTGGYLLIRN